ncbi:hypothetical protein [Frigoriglobus tundricola]|uniref:Uncharacterized protein n=1 Tax=Frigoriglobus tundricola TaxID=2774151 RepID=A0A6M5Z5D8_9BACT|nr:hypothetical protein [Frigoriglobus tundricola]QJX00772.1 hypothetical protein FTUN_8410 [Frigoriglobus tundricola]
MPGGQLLTFVECQDGPSSNDHAERDNTPGRADAHDPLRQPE